MFTVRSDSDPRWPASSVIVSVLFAASFVKCTIGYTIKCTPEVSTDPMHWILCDETRDSLHGVDPSKCLKILRLVDVNKRQWLNRRDHRRACWLRARKQSDTAKPV